MRIIVLGAGHVGMTIVEALVEEHEVTVVDLDPNRLVALSNTFDVLTVEGNGASRAVLDEAGIGSADLLIASTARDEANLVAAMLARRLCDHVRTLVRTTDVAHLRAWREGVLDVDFMVSSELETAREVINAIAVPGARATDVFAEGQVTIAEFDVEPQSVDCAFVGVPLAEAPLPARSRIGVIVRDDRIVVPNGGESLQLGDRVVVMASPESAREWGECLAPQVPRIEEALVYGADHLGLAIARKLLHHGLRVRVVEPDAERARRAAAALPDARVFHADGLDRDFLRDERIGRSDVAIAALRDDARSLYAATTARVAGVHTTIGVVDDPMSVKVFERAGVDVTVNPRTATAEELIRFAHDPRTRQIAMLDDERFDVLDVVVRPESQLVARRISEMPRTGSTIGAIVRDGRAMFPHGDDALQPGDRVIVLVDPARASRVEAAL